MPMIETMTIRFAPAAAPARWRFRAEAVKNAVASSWSGEGPVAVSMIVSAPASAGCAFAALRVFTLTTNGTRSDRQAGIELTISGQQNCLTEPKAPTGIEP